MTRETLAFIITAKSPLLLGGRKAAGLQTETMKFVPGRVLRGSVAQTLLRGEQHSEDVCEEHCDYCSLFNRDDRAIFRNAYPALKGEPSRPVPVSVMGCKINPEHHAPFDTLATLMISRLKGVPVLFECPVAGCGERVEKKAGYLLRHQGSLDFVKTAPDRELVRVGIDRARKTAADEILYNLIVVSDRVFDPKAAKNENNSEKVMEAAAFRGQIDCPQNLVGALERLLHDHIRHVGGAVSRGLGEVRISKPESPSPCVDLRVRCLKWNGFLADLLEKDNRHKLVDSSAPWSELDIDQLPARLRAGKSGFVSIDLLSDAILPDLIMHDDEYIHSGRYGFVLTESLLKQQSGSKSDIKLMMSLATAGTRSGWNAMWGVPRDVSIIAKAGSVFVFWCEDLESWYTHFEKFEKTGIGEDIDQGFGEVEFCSPEHMFVHS